jgi:hypothetical protein
LGLHLDIVGIASERLIEGIREALLGILLPQL